MMGLSLYHCCVFTAFTIFIPVLITSKEQQKIERPPSITEQPEKYVHFKKGEQVELPCIASTKPRPQYEWRKWKNNSLEVIVPDKRTSMNPGVGTLIISKSLEVDEGMYQCFASNKRGISVSIKVILQQATIEPFPSVKKPVEHIPLLGHKVTLECKPPKSIPKAEVFWTIESTKVSKPSSKPVVTNDRVVMDYEGNLHFANVEPQDAQRNKKYVCNAKNYALRSTNQGNDAIIKPFGGGNVPSVQPVDSLYTSDEVVLGLLGEEVKFMCIFSGTPTPTIKWTRKNGELDDRATTARSTHELTINNVQYSDKGEYECTGSNGIGLPVTKSFELKVEAMPYFTKEPQDAEIGVEESHVFNCKASGRPMPTVEWFINGIAIADATYNPRRELKNDRLIFTNLTKEDYQVIQCNASNIHGYKWADFYLNVLALPPTFDEPPAEETKVAEFQQTRLKCRASGKPDPVITWYKGGQQISGYGFTIEKSGDLLIKNTTKVDAGMYKCKAKNKFDTISAEGELKVRRRTEINIKPQNKTPVYGQDVEFACSPTTDADEIGNLKVTWYSEGKPVNLDDPRVSIRDDNLIIKNVMASDSGDYSCVADNGLDNATAKAVLAVKAPPDPPTNILFDTCSQRSAGIRWTAPESNFEPIKHYRVEEKTSFENVWRKVNKTKKTYNVISISPWGNYTFRVVAVNRLGESDPSEPSTVCSTLKAKPDRHPKNVKTPTDKTNFLVVEWETMKQSEHNGPDFVYNITITKGNITQTYIIDDHTLGRREIEVNTTHEAYEIQVFAQNSEGQALQKPKKFVGYSGEAKPSVVPQNFEIDRNYTTPTSARFLWDSVDTDPKVMNGIFTGYEIRIWKDVPEDEDQEERKVFFSGNQNGKRKRKRDVARESAVVENLPPYSQLLAVVVARNKHFSSDDSDVVSFDTPEGVPSKVKYFKATMRGSHHFVLEWGPPEHPNGNLIGYDLAYRLIDGLEIGDMVTAENITDIDRRKASVDNLLAEKKYSFYIWAKTKTGRGDVYFIDLMTADPGPPEKPRLIIGSVSDSYANISWDNTNVERAGEAHYVQYRQYGTKQWLKTPNETVNNWVNISGLETGVTFEARVVAVNKHGMTFSEREDFTTVGASAATEDIVSAGWFIAMMAIIAILLLFFIIVCIIKRNRGDKYHVQEKERLRGRDGENSDQDHFNDFPKGEENGYGKPGALLDNDVEKVTPQGSETDSMAEYGDVDPAKFNEDGSFIGQYGGMKTEGSEAPPQSAMSTFV